MKIHLKHIQLTLDVVEGRVSSFSLEIPFGMRFIIQSRILEPKEIENLEALFFAYVLKKN